MGLTPHSEANAASDWRRSELLPAAIRRLAAESGPMPKILTRAGAAVRVSRFERDWERMVTFYDYPREHWRHLRTTNPVESPFAALRLRTDAAKRYKRVDRAIAVIWKMLMVAGKRFRRLHAPELMEDVYLGVKYKDGVAIEAPVERIAA